MRQFPRHKLETAETSRQALQKIINRKSIMTKSVCSIHTSRAINRTAAEFISRYGLDGQILHYEYKRNLSWFTDLIPGKWSDFSGWKENMKTLQSDEKILKQCEKSTVESLYLEWIWKRNICFVLCVVMVAFSCRIVRNKAAFSCKNKENEIALSCEQR